MELPEQVLVHAFEVPYFPYLPRQFFIDINLKVEVISILKLCCEEKS